MPPTKKKINVNTVINTDIKSIDSFFINAGSNSSSQSIENQNKLEPTPVNITSLQFPATENKKNYQTKENILNDLTTHKIQYSLIDIKNKLEYLSENELTEIFKIIKNNNEKYTINKNGIFINLNMMKKNTIQELCNFIYFCDNNDKNFEEEEYERAKYKEMLAV